MGVVTLPCRDVRGRRPQELSGRRNCGPSRGQRLSAKHAVGGGADEVALGVEGVVDGGVVWKEISGLILLNRCILRSRRRVG